MPYTILDKNTIPAYLSSIEKVTEILGSDGDLSIDEIGDGNLNFVFRVFRTDDPEKSLILKQSVPYLRIAGEGWPLDKKRILFETRALSIYTGLIPEHVPEVYHSDEDMCTLVMEDLNNHVVLRNGMIGCVMFPKIGRHIGVFLAKSLFGTSSYGLGSLDRRKLMEQFVMNDELCKLTEEFVFTYPLTVHPLNYINPLTEQYANEHLRVDSEYKLRTLKLKEMFLSDKSALLHGDLHTGSLMVNESDTYIIDTEFACFGPIGFDLGKIIANFLLSYISHYQDSNEDYQEWIIGEVSQIINTFFETFLNLWNVTNESAMLIDGLLDDVEMTELKDSFILNILRDSVGFCACFMTRRILGTAGVADIRNVADVELRSKLEIISLKLAKLLMKSHTEITSSADFDEIVRNFFSNTELKCRF